MVAFGIYLMIIEGETEFKDMATLLTDINIRFRKQVTPGQKVFVTSEKTVFRHGRLQCKISLKNAENQLLCLGSISGMLYMKP